MIRSRNPKLLLPRLGAGLLRLRERRPVGAAAIRAAQLRQLQRLVALIAPCRSGRAAGLDRLVPRSGDSLFAAFRETVPVADPARLQDLFQAAARGEPDVFFPGTPVGLAQTSGTTCSHGPSEKYIPQGRHLLAQHRRGGSAALVRLLERDPSVLDGGRLLMLGGSTGLDRNDHGVPVGDLSGITASLVPSFLDGLYEPPRDIALETDWTRKIERLAMRLQGADVRLISGVPAWCQVLFDAVRRRAGVARLREAWPGLRAFVHGGASLEPLLPLLREELPEECLLQEVYPASEGFIAIGTRPWHVHEQQAPDLELLADHGLFLEFLPEGCDDSCMARGAWELEAGERYRLLLTTPGGLVRYEIGDVLEGRGPGFVRFAGRVRTRLSVFGEHVEGAALVRALGEACAREPAAVREYHVAPVLPSPEDPRGAHEWFVEFVRPPADPDRFARLLDETLRREVIDYDAHRQGDVQLLAPRLRMVPDGTFVRAMGRRGRVGGQNKVPQAWSDRSWAEDIEKAVEAAEAR